MSDEPQRWRLEVARTVAESIAHAIAPACERVEIAGSIRRCVTTVKDIELVVVPRTRRDLFGEILDEPTALDALVDELIAAGRFELRLSSAGTACNGRRAKRLTAVRSGIAVDLFAVLPPASFGAILAIRTGSAEYAECLVTVCQRRGLYCRDGRLVDAAGREHPTPTERDFIEACGVPYVEPWERR